jgi:hypothetical protein
VPNPARPGAIIQYFLPGARRADAALYDVAGRAVARLLSADQGGGLHSLSWNGRDGGSRRLPAGVYFLRAEVGAESLTGRILVVE